MWGREGTLKLVLILIAFSGLLLMPVGAQNAFAEIFGGINFPGGASSFADAVIRYNNLFGGGPPPPTPSNPPYLDPTESLGPPDWVNPFGSVTLGSGGLLEVRFVDNVLTNSGDASLDLHIFEIGTDIERTFVAIRPTAATAALLGPAFDLNADGFYEVGFALGATDSIDIDSFFSSRKSWYV